jgi:Arc/MetJ family transcription regulator
MALDDELVAEAQELTGLKGRSSVIGESLWTDRARRSPIRR